MDLAISGGDFTLGENGRPVRIEGPGELYQRAAIRLTVPLGAFFCNPSLGSRLHTLAADTPLRDQRALSMAQEALRGLTQLTVQSARFQDGDAPSVQITLKYGTETKNVEVKL